MHAVAFLSVVLTMTVTVLPVRVALRAVSAVSAVSAVAAGVTVVAVSTVMTTQAMARAGAGPHSHACCSPAGNGDGRGLRVGMM